MPVDENLIQCGIDLLMAGVDTTPNTMEFIMLYLLNYPEVQRKVQAEVDRVIGHVRRPTPNDRIKLVEFVGMYHTYLIYANQMSLNRTVIH